MRRFTLEEICWIYATRGEFDPEDLSVLKTAHQNNLQTMTGVQVAVSADERMLAKDLGIDGCGHSSMAESVAHVLDCVLDTEGDHLEAVRTCIREARQ